MNKIKSVTKRDGSTVPFTPQRISNAIYRAAVAVGGRDKNLAENLTNQVVEYLENTLPLEHIPNVEEIQDAVEKILIENGHAMVAKAYILYREERARMRNQRRDQSMHLSENIPWAKIWQILDWTVGRDLHTIEKYNERIRKGEICEIIRDSEIFYEEDIKTASQLINKRKDKLKVVLISGPSSSGKTTTTIKLGKLLEQMGITLTTLNVDNYFFDLADHPQDEFGDYDFETPQALDLELINLHLQDLIVGKQVLLPQYDFKTGTRSLDQIPRQITENEMILIDSLHGLYPDMTRSIPDEQKFKIYLEPLLQMKDSRDQYIRWTDIRLMRRMLRDAAYRSYEPEKTITHWHYVRASELRNIIPNLHTADSIINSAMPYELSIYQPKLINCFVEWVKKFKGDVLRKDAYERAERSLSILNEIIPISDDSIVPNDSVIREFIGGSTLNYH